MCFEDAQPPGDMNCWFLIGVVQTKRYEDYNGRHTQGVPQDIIKPFEMVYVYKYLRIQ
jgi:hypothetical protein